MKKAKLMLAVVAVFAVVGGSLAFKAAKFGSIEVFQAGTGGQTASTPVPGFSTTTADITQTSSGYYTAAFGAIVNAKTTIYELEDND